MAYNWFGSTALNQLLTKLKTALDGKSSVGHKHVKTDITDFPTSMPASDVYSWAKQSSKPTYTYGEVGAASSSHNHDDRYQFVGYYPTSAERNGNIDDLYNQLKGTTGGLGSVALSKKETGLGSDIPGGWYNYVYSPHRTGIGADNPQYGTLLLFPMTMNSSKCYVIRVSGGSIQEVRALVTAGDLNDYLAKSGGSLTGSLNTRDVIIGSSDSKASLTVNGTLRAYGNVNFDSYTVTCGDIWSSGRIESSTLHSGPTSVTSLDASSINVSGEIDTYGGVDVGGDLYVANSATVKGTLRANGELKTETVYPTTSNSRSIGKADHVYKTGYINTVYGTLEKESGGSWISGRDNAVVKQKKHTTSPGSSWNPVASVKTANGNWTIGNVGYDDLCFSFDTDADYTAGRNRSTVVTMPANGGTIALTNDNVASATKLNSYDIPNIGYGTNDTHILKLGYWACTGEYDNCTLLINSAFWGNQHGSSDIITMRQDRNGNGTEAGKVHATLNRVQLMADTGGQRVFYYLLDGDKIHLYVYVTGGNSYGKWRISVLSCSGATWNHQYGGNIALSSEKLEVPRSMPLLDGTGALGIWPISISGSADTVDGHHENSLAKSIVYSNASAQFFNNLASITNSALGMINCSDGPDGTANKWWHYIQMNYNNSYNGGPNNNNFWTSQIAIDPFNVNMYFRSRPGGNDPATGWTGWRNVVALGDVNSSDKCPASGTGWYSIGYTWNYDEGNNELAINNYWGVRINSRNDDHVSVNGNPIITKRVTIGTADRFVNINSNNFSVKQVGNIVFVEGTVGQLQQYTGSFYINGVTAPSRYVRAISISEGSDVEAVITVTPSNQVQFSFSKIHIANQHFNFSYVV